MKPRQNEEIITISLHIHILELFVAHWLLLDIRQDLGNSLIDEIHRVRQISSCFLLRQSHKF